MSDSVELVDCKAGLVPLGLAITQPLSDVLDDDVSATKGVCEEEDAFNFDLRCGEGSGEARKANEVEKRLESKIGSGPPAERDTKGDIFRQRSEWCGQYWLMTSAGPVVFWRVAF